VRERSLEKIDELMERTLAATGYEEVSPGLALDLRLQPSVRQLVENTVVRRPGRSG
jgi:hypothetical protein